MIVAGIGFRNTATVESLLDALHLTGQTPQLLASLPNKIQTPQMQQLAQRLDLPLVGIDLSDLGGQKTATCSERMLAQYGTGSLSEAAALAAAGPRGALLVPRVISSDRMATAALAKGPGS